MVWTKEDKDLLKHCFDTKQFSLTLAGKYFYANGGEGDVNITNIALQHAIQMGVFNKDTFMLNLAKEMGFDLLCDKHHVVIQLIDKTK